MLFKYLKLATLKTFNIGGLHIHLVEYVCTYQMCFIRLCMRILLTADDPGPRKCRQALVSPLNIIIEKLLVITSVANFVDNMFM